MSSQEQVRNASDVNQVVVETFPMQCERFCLHAPDGAVVELGGGLYLTLDAMVFEPPKEGAELTVEAITEEAVMLVPEEVMPLSRGRFVAYLAAVERCVSRQPLETLAELAPSTWFPASFLELSALQTTEDFETFIAATLPPPKDATASLIALAMVLLDAAVLPDAAALEKELAARVPGATVGDVRANDGVLDVTVGPWALHMVALPARVPAAELDRAAGVTFAAMLGERLADHSAHLLVTLTGDFARPLDRAKALVTCSAAVMSALSTHAVGVYLGESGLAHPTSFFMKETESALPMAALSGVRVAKSERGLELLSVGMTTLGLPEILVSAGANADAKGALDLFDAVLTLLARRGYGFPPGDTIGRDESEQLLVRYAPSPVDAKQPVLCIDLPA